MTVLRYWDATQGAYVALVSQGPQGAQGTQGFQGVQGTQGVQGPPPPVQSPLAYVRYGTSSMASYSFGTTVAAIDPVNLTIAFKAPASGSVIVRAWAYIRCITTNTQGTGYEVMPNWGFVNHGTTTVVSALVRALDLSTAYPNAFAGLYTPYEATVTGLTPNANYQWDLAGQYYATGGAGAGATMYVDNGVSGTAVGPCIMAIYDMAGVGAQGPQGFQGPQGAGVIPGGPAGGDLGGTYPSPSVIHFPNSNYPVDPTGAAGGTIPLLNLPDGVNWQWQYVIPGGDLALTAWAAAGFGNTVQFQCRGIYGHPVASTAPATGMVMRWNGSSWGPTLLNRVVNGGQASSYTPNVDQCEMYTIGSRGNNGISPNGNFTINGPAGTANDGQKLLFRIWAPAAYAISWASPGYYNSGVASVPTVCAAGAEMHVLFIMDGAAGQWICMAVDSKGF